MKNISSFILSLLVRLVAAVLLGVLLLALVYCIPPERIEAQLVRSSDTLKAEGTYPELTPYAVSILDNWTDSIMLLEAAFPSEDPPLVSAMQVKRYAYGDDFPDQSLVQYAENGAYHYIQPYPQYWHGYLVFLKPLLSLLDFSGIRAVNACGQLLVAALIVLLLWKQGRKAFILPYLLSIAMLMPLALAKCMQFSSCYYIFSLSSLAMLLLKEDALNSRRPLLIFFYTGIATAYFDFLSYPISTFGVPAVFYLLRRDSLRPRETLRAFLLALLMWGVGYGGMWLGKLVVGSWITGLNYFQEADSHVGHWFNGERWFSVGYVLYYNLRDFIYTPVSLFALPWAGLLLIQILRSPYRASASALIAAALPYAILALLPFLWYLVMLNPSGVHFFFTNKALVVTAFSGLSMLVSLRELTRQRL